MGSATRPPRTTGLQVSLVSLVRQLEAARDELDAREYDALLGVLVNWLSTERGRIARGRQLRATGSKRPPGKRRRHLQVVR